MARAFEEQAALTVYKEALSLHRLGAEVPPNPFVVRYIDSGSLQLVVGTHISLPWVAVEYVHGGVEGTTLAERVACSIESTSFAFDANRAAQAVECIGGGIAAMHRLGVVHRDLKPENILCCGFGTEEILKISDFGVARPADLAPTFGGLLVGTPGYAAPEQAGVRQARQAAWMMGSVE